MSKRTVFMVTVAGTNITTMLLPVLTSLTVSDKVGTHSDTASLEIDDTDGRIVLPQIGAPVIVALGREGEGMRVVFTGTVDEVRASGSRGGGRALSITAKGMDTRDIAAIKIDMHEIRTRVGMLELDIAWIDQPSITRRLDSFEQTLDRLHDLLIGQLTHKE